MEAFPAFFPLNGRRVVIAGEGEGAEAKARLLAGSPAAVSRLEGEAALAADSYAGAALVFVASPDAAFRAGAAAAARAAGAVVNVVDHPALSDFHTPAIIDRGQVVAAIGTAGAAPMLAAILRAELETRIPEGLGALARLLGEHQDAIRAAFPDLPRRRAFLRAVLGGGAMRAATDGDLAQAGRLILSEIATGGEAVGKVWLIETPPARDLLSLRAARALGMADILVLGARVGTDLTVLARRDATWRTLAETGDAVLAEAAADGRQVVVLAGAAELASLSVVGERLFPAPGPSGHPPLKTEGS